MGIPTVVGLLELNRERGLHAVSITAADEDDFFLTKARELGLENSIASANWHGEDSPYLNLNKTTGPTYVFVISRCGGVVWRGDPSTKLDEFLEAVQDALAVPAAPALPGSLREELSKAVTLYVGRDYEKARAKAERLRSKNARKKSAEARGIVVDAEKLIGLIDQHLADLVQRLQASCAEQSAEAIASSYRDLSLEFPKSEATEQARDRLEGFGDDLIERVEGWRIWLELAAERPPLFPGRREKAEKRYAAKLKSYVKKRSEGPGAELAREWLDVYAKSK